SSSARLPARTSRYARNASAISASRGVNSAESSMSREIRAGVSGAPKGGGSTALDTTNTLVAYDIRKQAPAQRTLNRDSVHEHVSQRHQPHGHHDGRAQREWHPVGQPRSPLPGGRQPVPRGTDPPDRQRTQQQRQRHPHRGNRDRSVTERAEQ